MVTTITNFRIDITVLKTTTKNQFVYLFIAPVGPYRIFDIATLLIIMTSMKSKEVYVILCLIAVTLFNYIAHIGRLVVVYDEHGGTHSAVNIASDNYANKAEPESVDPGEYVTPCFNIPNAVNKETPHPQTLALYLSGDPQQARLGHTFMSFHHLVKLAVENCLTLRAYFSTKGHGISMKKTNPTFLVTFSWLRYPSAHLLLSVCV